MRTTACTIPKPTERHQTDMSPAYYPPAPTTPSAIVRAAIAEMLRDPERTTEDDVDRALERAIDRYIANALRLGRKFIPEDDSDGA